MKKSSKNHFLIDAKYRKSMQIRWHFMYVLDNNIVMPGQYEIWKKFRNSYHDVDGIIQLLVSYRFFAIVEHR